MQYFRINISEACRCHLGVILFFLNLSIMVVCHATGAMGLFVKQEASSFGNFLVFYNTSSLFKLLLCLSLLFLLFHLVGAKICYDSAFYETRERFHSVLFYWLLAGVALVPLTVAAIIVLTAHQSMVVRGIGLGFKQAMKRYKIDTPMREYINRLQVEHQCCGATSISDWYRVSWVDTSNAAPINRLANSHFMESNGEFLPRWAPFSCCRQDIIGTPCESVALFFNPTKNKEWVQKSNIYSVDYLSEYEKYAALYKRVKKASKKPPQDVVRRGRAIVQNRRSTFDTFLREVTGHRDMKPPPSPSDEHSPRVDGKTETIRAMFEAQGVKVRSFPEELFSRLGKPPWQGRMAWSYDNVTTAESGNLDQLLRLDGRQEDSTLELLRWRSFNQAGCAEPIGRMARLAMRAADFLFVFVLVAQVWILTLTRYLQTSIDTAYRWGNPLLSAPGFLFNTSLPPRPDDFASLLHEENLASNLLDWVESDTDLAEAQDELADMMYVGSDTTISTSYDGSDSWPSDDGSLSPDEENAAEDALWDEHETEPMRRTPRQTVERGAESWSSVSHQDDDDGGSGHKESLHGIPSEVQWSLPKQNDDESLKNHFDDRDDFDDEVDESDNRDEYSGKDYYHIAERRHTNDRDDKDDYGDKYDYDNADDYGGGDDHDSDDGYSDRQDAGDGGGLFTGIGRFFRRKSSRDARGRDDDDDDRSDDSDDSSHTRRHHSKHSDWRDDHGDLHDREDARHVRDDVRTSDDSDWLGVRDAIPSRGDDDDDHDEEGKHDDRKEKSRQKHEDHQDEHNHRRRPSQTDHRHDEKSNERETESSTDTKHGKSDGKKDKLKDDAAEKHDKHKEYKDKKEHASQHKHESKDNGSEQDKKGGHDLSTKHGKYGKHYGDKDHDSEEHKHGIDTHKKDEKRDKDTSKTDKHDSSGVKKHTAKEKDQHKKHGHGHDARSKRKGKDENESKHHSAQRNREKSKEEETHDHSPAHSDKHERQKGDDGAKDENHKRIKRSAKDKHGKAHEKDSTKGHESRKDKHERKTHKETKHKDGKSTSGHGDKHHDNTKQHTLKDSSASSKHSFKTRKGHDKQRKDRSKNSKAKHEHQSHDSKSSGTKSSKRQKSKDNRSKSHKEKKKSDKSHDQRSSKHVKSSRSKSTKSHSSNKNRSHSDHSKHSSKDHSADHSKSHRSSSSKRSSRNGKHHSSGDSHKKSRDKSHSKGRHSSRNGHGKSHGRSRDRISSSSRRHGHGSDRHRSKRGRHGAHASHGSRSRRSKHRSHSSGRSSHRNKSHERSKRKKKKKKKKKNRHH